MCTPRSKLVTMIHVKVQSVCNLTTGRGHGDNVSLCMHGLIRHREIVGTQLQDCALYKIWHGLFDLSIAA
jgi:hypothetical protein